VALAEEGADIVGTGLGRLDEVDAGMTSVAS